MAEPFRIRLGDHVPVQHAQVTCGSASLTVARMLVDPVFARWVVVGDPDGRDLPGGDTEDQRFAAFEKIVMARTNALVGPGGRVQLPWPHRFGTPPWGARRELEDGAAEAGTRYEVTWCRLGGKARLQGHYEQIGRRAAPERPALLYIGNAWLPRHVTLVVPAESGDDLEVYDPASGQVEALPVEGFASRQLHVAGWDVPWCVVQPRAD